MIGRSLVNVGRDLVICELLHRITLEVRGALRESAEPPLEPFCGQMAKAQYVRKCQHADRLEVLHHQLGRTPRLCLKPRKVVDCDWGDEIIDVVGDLAGAEFLIQERRNAR